MQSLHHGRGGTQRRTGCRVDYQFIALPHGADRSSRNTEIEVRLPGTMTLRRQGTAAQQGCSIASWRSYRPLWKDFHKGR